jgi:hypothetical protein
VAGRKLKLRRVALHPEAQQRPGRGLLLLLLPGLLLLLPLLQPRFTCQVLWGGRQTRAV